MERPFFFPGWLGWLVLAAAFAVPAPSPPGPPPTIPLEIPEFEKDRNDIYLLWTSQDKKKYHIEASR